MKVEAAESFPDVVKSTNKNIAEELNSKTRTVSLEGGEDDATGVNINTVAAQTLSCANGLRIKDIYVPKIFQFVGK